MGRRDTETNGTGLPMWFCLDRYWSEKMKFLAMLGWNLWSIKLHTYPYFILLLHFKWVQDSIATLTWGFENQTHEFTTPYSLLPLFWMQLMRIQLIKHWFIGPVLGNCCNWVFSVSHTHQCSLVHCSPSTRRLVYVGKNWIHVWITFS